MLFCFIFLFMAAAGGGSWSVDARRAPARDRGLLGAARRDGSLTIRRDAALQVRRLHRGRARHPPDRPRRGPRQRDLRHQGDHARHRRDRRRRASPECRPRHLRAGDQPARLREQAAHRRPQPQPQARADRHAARVRGPLANWLCPLLARTRCCSTCTRSPRPACRSSSWGPATTSGRSSPSTGPRARKRWPCASASAARSTAGSHLCRRRRAPGERPRVSRGDARPRPALRHRHHRVHAPIGGSALTLECGQHDDPPAPEVAYRAIMNTLAHLRLIDAPIA